MNPNGTPDSSASPAASEEPDPVGQKAPQGVDPAHAAAWLDARLVTYRQELEVPFARFDAEVVTRLAAAMHHLVEDWQANLAMQVEIALRAARAEPQTNLRRSAVFCSLRDGFRWARRLSERRENDFRGVFVHANAFAPLAAVFAATDSLSTVSAPLDASIYAPEPGDGWWRHMRKRLALGRLTKRPCWRGVPLRDLARAFVVPVVVRNYESWLHRAGALRVFFWRRLRDVVHEIVDHVVRLDHRLRAGEPVGVEDVAATLGEGLQQLHDDIQRFVREMRERSDRLLAAAIGELRYAALRSDTFLLPDRVWETSSVEADPEYISRIIKEACEGWNRLADGAVGELGVLLDGGAFTAAVRYAGLRDAVGVHEAIRDGLVEPARAASAALDSAILRLEAATCAIPAADGPRKRPRTETGSLPTLNAAMLELPTDGDQGPDLGDAQAAFADTLELARQRIHGELHAVFMVPVRENVGRERATASLREFERSLTAAAARIHPRFHVPSVRKPRLEEGDPPPQVELRPVELRHRAQVLVLDRVLRRTAALNQDIGQAADRVAEGAREVLAIVDFSLETTIEQHVRGDDGTEANRTVALEAVRAGVERARARLGQIETEVDAVLATLPSALLDGVEEPVRDFELALRGMDDSLTMVGGGVTGQGVTPDVTVAPDKVVDDTVRIRFGPHGLKSVVTLDDLMRTLRGSAQVELEQSGLPQSYWRLFSSDGAVSGPLRVGHDATQERFAEMVSDWQNGDPESLALIGVNGSGKASVVDRLCESLTDRYPIVRVRIRERILRTQSLIPLLTRQLGLNVDTADAFCDALLDREERLVIVVEAAERLFLRHPQGLEAMRSLLTLVGSTAERVLWIVSFERAAFDFLSTTLEVSEAFTNVLEVPLLDRREVEQLLMLRHRMSGMRLRFDARELGQSGESEEVLQGRLFDRIFAISHGHPAVSLHTWLTAVREVNPRGEVVLGSPCGLPGPLLAPLDGRKCAALAALIVHGGLDRAGFAHTMRISLDEAGTLLAQLRHLHLVEAGEGARGIYRMHRVALLDLYLELKRRNVL